MANRTLSLIVYRNDSIESVKAKIQDKEGMVPKDQILIYAGKQLEDGLTLEHYDVRRRKTIHLELRIRGGGGPFPLKFIDVTSNAIERLTVSPWAPEWRIFDKGLTMEGLCKNTQCVAHNKKVLCQKGYMTYNLQKDISACPMCRSAIDPIRPLYYKCVVVYNGMKSDGSRISSPLKKFDLLQSYKVEEAGMCEYKFLIIQVKEPGNLIIDTKTQTEIMLSEWCSICHKSLQKSRAKFPSYCGHMFHQECVDKWRKVNTHCPLCSLDFI